MALFCISYYCNRRQSYWFPAVPDLVPTVSAMFLKRCIRIKNGYVGTIIQRIVLPSWIQCGGWNLKNKRLPCENYTVPHDRRGVLSMCHNGKHNDNSTQFFITLDPTPWMDYKYVAFGQLLQGEEILRSLEKVPTIYETPTRKIEIVKCGEYNLCPCSTINSKSVTRLEKFLTIKDDVTNLHEDVIDPRDAKSVLLKRRYERGLYCSESDLKSHIPFLHLPDHLIYKSYLEETYNECAENCTCSDTEPKYPTEVTQLSTTLENVLETSYK